MDMVCTLLLAWPKIENVEKAASSTICLRYFFIIYFIIFNMGQPAQIKDSRNTSNKPVAKNFIEKSRYISYQKNTRQALFQNVRGAQGCDM